MMASLIVTLRSGEVREVPGTPGRSVKDVILDAGIFEIHGVTHCGGCCSCGTCHVIFDEVGAARAPAPDDDERDMLDIVIDRQPTSRLACQVPFTAVLDGARVRIGAE
jgi:ferredoxin, 2Fe-2S